MTITETMNNNKNNEHRTICNNKLINGQDWKKNIIMLSLNLRPGGNVNNTTFRRHQIIHVSYYCTLIKILLFPIFDQATHTIDIKSTVRTIPLGMHIRTFDGQLDGMVEFRICVHLAFVLPLISRLCTHDSQSPHFWSRRVQHFKPRVRRIGQRAPGQDVEVTCSNPRHLHKNSDIVCNITCPFNQQQWLYWLNRQRGIVILKKQEYNRWSKQNGLKLYPRERPGTHCTGSWVGSRAGLNVCEKSRPHWDSINWLSSP
jgi:hypothetical protein